VKDFARGGAPASDGLDPVAPPWPYREDSVSYSFVVNGQQRAVEDAWLGESLLYVLRERLGLPGAKNACEQGECSSCLIWLDGMLACSCCVLGADAAGSEVQTVESAASSGGADIQRALVDYGAVQCGFCTPGFVVAIQDLLDREPNPGPWEVKEALAGNLCRCTGYSSILRAVEQVVEGRRHG
jgi:carbon-monoxide dehydrogenase small subunit